MKIPKENDGRRLLVRRIGRRGPVRDATRRIEVPYCPYCGSLKVKRGRTIATFRDADGTKINRAQRPLAGITVTQLQRCLNPKCGLPSDIHTNIVAAESLPRREQTLGGEEQ